DVEARHPRAFRCEPACRRRSQAGAGTGHEGSEVCKALRRHGGSQKHEPVDARNVLDAPGGRRLVGGHADRSLPRRPGAASRSRPDEGASTDRDDRSFAHRMLVTGALARAGALALVFALAACTARRDVPLRIAVTESGGDFMLSLEQPVRAVACVVRDYRRSPTDPAATRAVWTARCTEGAYCRTSVRYGDRTLETTGPGEPLAPSE